MSETEFDPRQTDELRARFREHGQAQVFRFWDRLDEAERSRLARQAARVDLPGLDVARKAASAPEAAPPGALEPAEAIALPEFGGDAARAREAEDAGRQILAEGRVGLLVVAGGQGTRLGFPGPKGAFPLGPVTDRSLFEIQAQKIRGLRRRFGRPLPWYVMTSEATDLDTRAFFAAHQHFGLPAEDIVFFTQGMIQSLDFDGRLILERPDRIFENPNGHGGTLTALLDSGSLDDMKGRGVDRIFYYQVDNPLVRIGDPVYLGFHELSCAEMSCKVIRKLDPMEKVGIVTRADGKMGMVEYTELRDEHRHARDEQGNLRFWTGNLAIHGFNTDFVRRVASDADQWLPYHASAKAIPCTDEEGRTVTPSEPNGHKLERFVFDALPAARAVCVVEARREDEYSPVKNAEGPNSPATARADLVAQYRRWLGAGGVSAPSPAEFIEIDHSRIDDAAAVAELGIRGIEEAADAIRIGPGVAA